MGIFGEIVAFLFIIGCGVRLVSNEIKCRSLQSQLTKANAQITELQETLLSDGEPVSLPKHRNGIILHD